MFSPMLACLLKETLEAVKQLLVCLSDGVVSKSTRCLESGHHL